MRHGPWTLARLCLRSAQRAHAEQNVFASGNPVPVHQPSTRLSSPVTSGPLQSAKPPRKSGLRGLEWPGAHIGASLDGETYDAIPGVQLALVS
jgi:hypothetical protein